MTAPPEGRLGRRAALAAAAVMALAAFFGVRAAAAPAPVTWSLYRSTARAVMPAAAAGPVRLPSGSALRGRAVRFPDGEIVAVDPALLADGLAAAPGSSIGAAARSALAAVVAAPPNPAPVPPPGPAERRLATILQDPAFAGARPGPFWRIEQRLQAVLSAVGNVLARWVAVPAGSRAFWVVAGLVAVLGGGLAAVRVARGGLDRAERPRRRRAAGGGRAGRAAGWPDARDPLASGDLPTAVRLIYAEALRGVQARRHVAIRPGWTARDIQRAAGLDTAWPGFAGLAALHERVIFGPPPPASGVAALRDAAESWLAEVRRWSAGGAG